MGALSRWVLPFVLALGIGGVAHAAPSPRDRQDAAVLTGKARAAGRQKKYDEAIELLRKADQLDPTSARKLELAKLLVAAGQLVEASRILNGLANDPSLGPRDKWAKFQAKKQLAQFEARIPWLQVHVIGPTRDVHIEVDGREVEPDTETPIDPGKHAIGVDADGFESGDRSVTLAEGEHKQVTITLQPIARPQEAPKEKPGSGTKAPAIAAFAIGAAGIGVGAVFGILAFDETAKAKQYCDGNKCPARPEVVAARNVAIANGNVSTVGFVVGGVGVAAGIVLALTLGGSSDKPAGKDEQKDAFTVRPFVNIGGIGSPSGPSAPNPLSAGEVGIVGTF